MGTRSHRSIPIVSRVACSQDFVTRSCPGGFQAPGAFCFPSRRGWTRSESKSVKSQPSSPELVLDTACVSGGGESPTGSQYRSGRREILFDSSGSVPASVRTGLFCRLRHLRRPVGDFDVRGSGSRSRPSLILFDSSGSGPLAIRCSRDYEWQPSWDARCERAPVASGALSKV